MRFQLAVSQIEHPCARLCHILDILTVAADSRNQNQCVRLQTFAECHRLGTVSKKEYALIIQLMTQLGYQLHRIEVRFLDIG